MTYYWRLQLVPSLLPLATTPTSLKAERQMDLKIHTMRKVADLLLSLDGMFGRCEAAPLTDVYTYDVTPATVQRFRTLLQRLAHRGRCISVAVATAHISVTKWLFLELLCILGRIESSVGDAVCVYVTFYPELFSHVGIFLP